MSQLKLNNNILSGYNFPFEGNKHKATIILLPYREDTWREEAKPGLDVFYQLVSIISKYELVHLIVDPCIPKEKYNRFIMKNVKIHVIPYNDAWARDNTLIYLQKDHKNLAIDFGFNAWGGQVDGLYPDYQKDNELGKNLALEFDDDFISIKDFILEGGSIHTDGEGTLLTTEACLLSKGRNSSLSKEEIEEKLKKCLGIKKILWLPRGIYNDETNEHVDNVACFLKPGVIALASCHDEKDIQNKFYKMDLEYLNSQVDAKGRKLHIVEIETPIDLKMSKNEADGLILTDAITRPEGNRLAASYINFYQSDKFVIVPKFNHPLDENAYQILKTYYKEKDVYQLESREILLGGGNIHCVTMQIPKE
ncbi:MAG: agmatine deiminase family protein [Bacillales bacterium]|nr:agmatine deiminase family protein [Bacillales bacterium]